METPLRADADESFAGIIVTRPVYKQIVRVLVSLGLLALVVLFADWRTVWQVLRAVDPAWLVAVLLASVAERAVISYRWQILLAGRGIVLGFFKLFRVQLAANFVGLFLPGFLGIDALRIAALYRAGEPMVPVVAATLMDRATLAFATLVAGALAILLLAQERVPVRLAQSILVLAGVALVLVGVSFHKPVRSWVRLVLLPRLPGRFRQKVNEVADASLEYRHQHVLVAAVIFVTLVVFALRIVFAMTIAQACGVDLSWLDLLLVIPILWVIVMLPITMGGLGLQDAGYVVLMALIGISAPVAVGMSLVEHVMSRLAILPGVLFIPELTEKKGPISTVRDSIAASKSVAGDGGLK